MKLLPEPRQADTPPEPRASASGQAPPEPRASANGPAFRRAFHPLDPPSGGLARLRQRLVEQEPPPRPAWPFWLAGAAAAAALAAVLLWPPSGSDRRTADAGEAPPVEDPPVAVASAVPLSDNPLLIAAGLAPAPVGPVELRGVSAADAALTRVAVSDPDVVFYLVADGAPRAQTNRDVARDR